MTSDGDASPISVLDERQMNSSIPNTSMTQTPQDNSTFTGDTGRPSVTKKPFLKRGSRMPISRIPDDPFTPVVAPIRNPPRIERVGEAAVGAHDLERPRATLDDRPEIVSRPTSAIRRPVSRSSPVVTKADPRWEEIAAKHTEDLESFLRDIGSDGSRAARASSERARPAANDLMKTTQFYDDNPLNESVGPISTSSSTFRRQKGAAPATTRPDTMETLLYGQKAASVRPATSPAPVTANPAEDVTDVKAKLRELDAQIEKFKKENDHCKKLRLERETALAEAQRHKERALRELEAAERDIEEQRSAILTERKRLQQDKDRGRSMVSQVRDLMEENRGLKEKIAELESEWNGKCKKLKNEVLRLNSLLNEAQKDKAELELELRSVVVAPLTQQRISVPPQYQPSRPVYSSQQSSSIASSGGCQSPYSPDDEIASYTHPDGRIDRTYPDGRREAVFPSGLRKCVWPDGAALVHFPNGDVKETSADGVVTYQYSSTGCVQTTYPDGVEVLKFTSGQTERHLPDGTKEITFPNRMVKLIDRQGREQLITRGE